MLQMTTEMVNLKEECRHLHETMYSQEQELSQVKQSCSLYSQVPEDSREFRKFSKYN